MIRFITLFIGAFLAVMIAIQEIMPYFITDIEFPQSEKEVAAFIKKLNH